MVTRRRPKKTKTAVPNARPLVREKATELATKPTRDAGPRALTDDERAVLERVIERARAVSDQHNAAWAEFGRWLFTHVFGDDTSAAIDHREDNSIWVELFRLADSAKVRVRHDALERAVLCAAYDKRLNHDAWRALDFERKWRLLRLEDEKLLRKGAQHVLATNLNTEETAVYVRRVLAENETPVPVRVNVSALARQLSKLSERVGTKGFLRQFESAANKLDDEARDGALAQLDAARAALDALREKLAKE